jgi:hypothetical protein
MARNLIGSLLLVLYVNILPFACRLVHGVEWLTAYLPEGFSGFLFFAFLNTIAAGPILLTWWMRRRLPITWIVSLVTTTALLCFLHHDYDLGADAQSAIALLFFPIIAAIATAVVSAIAGLIEFFARKEAVATRPRQQR